MAKYNAQLYDDILLISQVNICLSRRKSILTIYFQSILQLCVTKLNTQVYPPYKYLLGLGPRYARRRQNLLPTTFHNLTDLGFDINYKKISL